jgi:hypothetical protein
MGVIKEIQKHFGLFSCGIGKFALVVGCILRLFEIKAKTEDDLLKQHDFLVNFSETMPNLMRMITYF